VGRVSVGGSHSRSGSRRGRRRRSGGEGMVGLEAKIHPLTNIHHISSSLLSTLSASRQGSRTSGSKVPLPSDFPPPARMAKKAFAANSPVKKDLFFPAEDVPLLEALDPVSSDSDVCSTESQVQLCPCCKRNVNLQGVSLHNHLVLCLKGSKGSSKLFSKRDDKKKIKEMRKVISKLNLHLRIGIMESFYRLSRGVTMEPPSPRLLPSFGTNAEASDKNLLALLYGKRAQRIRSRRKMPAKDSFKLPRNMKRNITASKSRALSLTKTSMKTRPIKLDSFIL